MPTRLENVIRDDQLVEHGPCSHVAIILDRSGSMTTTKAATIRGFNEQIQSIKSNATGGDTFVSLTLFNGDIEDIFFNVDASALTELTNDTYHPYGSTAMLDAVGHVLDRLHNETDATDEHNRYLILIISDGEENASRAFDYTTIAERIQELQTTNRWTITYMGANQDLAVVRERLNLHAGNMSSYTATNDGTAVAYSTMRAATGQWVNSADTSCTQDFYSGQ